jgi:hypothetical protein
MRIYKLVFDSEPEKSQDLFQISSFGRLNDCNFGFVLHDLELNEMECFWIFEIFVFSEFKEFFEQISDE